MTGYRLGLDLGSTAVKAVLVNDGRLIWSAQAPTAPGQEALADRLAAKGMSEAGLAIEDLEAVVATGYGKGLIARAGAKVDEITANARGLHVLSGGRCRTIVNIGGQDLKVILLEADGRVGDFRMNDKCAAGTGRFFEQAARILDTPLSSFGQLGLSPGPALELNSTCAVFAETEMVSLLAKGADKAGLVKALHRSVARRVGHLLGRGDPTPEIWLDGGPANNKGLVAAIEDELMTEVRVLSAPQYTVAYGAAITV